MPFKKTNEAYFGDSFNRDSVLCYATADAKASDSASFSCKNATINLDTLASITGCCDLTAKADSGVLGISYVEDKVSMDSFNDLIARVVALESNTVPKKGADELRCALKTLNYTREVQ